MSTVPPQTRPQAVDWLLSTGYAGRAHLRSASYHTLINRVRYEEKKAGVPQDTEWKLISPKFYWLLIKMYAQDQGLPIGEAWHQLQNIEVDPLRNPPHPLLCEA